MIRHARSVAALLVAAFAAGLMFTACGPALAQGRPAGAAAALSPAAAQPAASATPVQAGYFGATVAPEPRGVTITAIAPGSPADQAGFQVGETLTQFWDAVGAKRRSQSFFDQAQLDAWQASKGAGSQHYIYYIPTKPGLTVKMRSVILASAADAPGATGPAAAAEKARSAYLAMCGRGAEKLSASVCDSMRRDVEAADAAREAAAHEADVMAAYQDLCAPNARKVSEATCAGMLAEAKRAAPSAVVARPTVQRAAAAAPAVKTQASAYDELCGGASPLVSADTCAALKADAGR